MPNNDTLNNNEELKVLSIDAWKNYEGWECNQWYKVATIEKIDFEKIEKSTRKVLNWFRKNELLSDYSKGRVYIEDDGYNIVVCDKNNNCPLFAIEYGPVYN